MRNHTINLALSVVFALALLSGSANAGTIVVTSLTNNESDIVNTGGTVVSAANLGGGGNSTVDINGISHTYPGTGHTINSTFNGNYRSGQAATAGYTGDMLDLMGGIAGRAAPGPIAMDISGLDVGKNYLFQGYWEANNFNQTASVTFEGTDTQGGITGVGGLGSLISYTFTAGDTVLDADLTKTGGTDNIWWLGYSLQEVPEPSSFVLAALGLLGLLACGRRRKR